MTDVVVFAEEPSGRVIAECLAQKLGIADRTICIQHSGVKDLERSIRVKTQAWGRRPRFLIMRDNDGADCLARKRHLRSLILPNVATRVKVRIVMQELESWYFGDMDAVVRAGFIDIRAAEKKLRKMLGKDPDTIVHVKENFKRHIVEAGQMELAQGIGPQLSLESNRSRSFHAFVDALRWAADLTREP